MLLSLGFSIFVPAAAEEAEEVDEAEAAAFTSFPLSLLASFSSLRTPQAVITTECRGRDEASTGRCEIDRTTSKPDTTDPNTTC